MYNIVVDPLLASSILVFPFSYWESLTHLSLGVIAIDVVVDSHL